MCLIKKLFGCSTVNILELKLKEANAEIKFLNARIDLARAVEEKTVGLLREENTTLWRIFTELKAEIKPIGDARGYPLNAAADYVRFMAELKTELLTK